MPWIWPPGCSAGERSWLPGKSGSGRWARSCGTIAGVEWPRKLSRLRNQDEMSRTYRFLGGLTLGYAHQILVVAAALWLTPFLLRNIGEHDYGLWLAGGQILLYLGLLDFGVVDLLPRE